MTRDTPSAAPPDGRAAATSSSRPRRRWSDGPNYPWSTGAEEEGAPGAQYPALVALLSETIAECTHGIGQELERLKADGHLSSSRADGLHRHRERLRVAGLAAQQVVRLGAGSVALSPEPIDLTRLARQMVQERQAEWLRAGIQVRLDIRPAQVWMDAAAAVQLLQTAFDWALSFSSAGLELKIQQASAERPARMVVRGILPSPGIAPPRGNPVRRNRRMNDNIHWVLLRQLAGASKLGISRSSSAATEAVAIEFPKRVCSDGELASVELLAAGSAQPMLPDAWVLAVVRDPALRESVLKLMLQHGLEASVADSCDQARQLCRTRKPKVLVSCPETFGAAQLREEFAQDAACAHVQIVRATASFPTQGFAGWGTVKVGLGELRKDLVPTLLFELAQQN